MEFTNLTEIISCLKRWEEVRNDSDQVLKYLGPGDHFVFKRDKPTALNLHAYPGICEEDNGFYMFLIDAAADRDSTDTDLFNAITSSKVHSKLSHIDEITEEEAKRRIANWNTEYTGWVTAQVNASAQTGGLFRAFNLPSSYMERNAGYKTAFGLNPSSKSAGNFDADLISINSGVNVLTYFNTVRPVPPFDVIPQSDFYLLSKV